MAEHSTCCTNAATHYVRQVHRLYRSADLFEARYVSTNDDHCLSRRYCRECPMHPCLPCLAQDDVVHEHLLCHSRRSADCKLTTTAALCAMGEHTEWVTSKQARTLTTKLRALCMRRCLHYLCVPQVAFGYSNSVHISMGPI